MANPTTYFGWVMPNSADLVTDLPADFNVFGQGVDTSMQYLLGGTTGQVLSKTSGTNMAFTWVTPQVGDITGVTAGVGISGGGTSGDVTVTNSMATAITTNGDLIYGTGSGTFTRRAIGSTGNVLTVAGGIPTWAAPAGGGKVLQVVQAVTQTNTSITSASFTDSSITATITPTLNTSKVLVLVSGQVNLVRTTGASRQTRLASNICRNGTSVFDDSSGQTFGVQFTSITSGSTDHFSRVALNYLDSPATTSATTYKVQYAGDTAWTINCQQGSAMSSIILLEIGA